MRRVAFATVLAVSCGAFAQGAASVQRSSSPQGVRIQGDVIINTDVRHANAVAAGADNVTKTATAAVNGGTQIHGNTRIDAKAKNVNAVAVGKGNAATNDVGSIGGK